MINHAWALLDIFITGALCNIIDADVVEVGLLVGKLEPIPKLQVIRRILQHKNDNRAKPILTIIKLLESQRNSRNAITHGKYEGQTEDKMDIFTMTSSFLIGDGETATAAITFTLHDYHEHMKIVSSSSHKIAELFGLEKTRELLSLPSRPPSYNPPKAPRKRADKNQAKRQRPRQS